MRKLFVVVATVALVAGACGGGDDAAASNSCEGLADQAIALVQTVVDEIDGMSAQELADSGGNFASLDTLSEGMVDLEAKASEIGCSDAEMEQLVLDRVDNLKANSEFGQMMISQFESSGLGSGN
jgi:hypothetical protein